MILNALPEPDLDHALQLAAEYLPDLDQDAFVRMYKRYPDLYIGCYEQDTLIGVCFGFPFTEVRSNEAGKMLL
jgi:hypothetical protein